MRGGENVSAIPCGKCRRAVGGRVKNHLQRGRVRLLQHIRDDCLTGEIRSFTGMAGVFMVAHIIPGPAVESALFYAIDGIGHQIASPATPTPLRLPVAKARRGSCPSGSVTRMSAR